MTTIAPRTLSRRSSSRLSITDSSGRNAVRSNVLYFVLGAVATIVCGAIVMVISSSSSSSASSSSSLSTTNQGGLTTIGSSGSSSNGHLVIIDAGSSGSRAHVFQYDRNNGVVNPKHESLKVKPGLSSYVNNPSEAGVSLGPLLDFARQHIPSSDISKTKIVLKATAGMRLLQTNEQNIIINNVREYLSSSDFMFNTDDAAVIDGMEEGLLGWLAVNYLQDDKTQAGQWSVLEMGGASIQFTMPKDQAGGDNNVPPELTRSYNSPFDNQSKGKVGSVYTHSFIGLGMESARGAINDKLQSLGSTSDPCLPTNYIEEHDVDVFSGIKTITPAGNFDQCKELVSNTIFKPQEGGPCEYEKCLYNGMYAPKLDINEKFWAFENFFYTPSGLGVDGVPGNDISINDIINAGKVVCSMNWNDVDNIYPKDNQPKDVNEKWCFGSAYLSTLLTEGLGFDINQKFTIGNNVGNNGIDWALGAALQAALEESSTSTGNNGKLRGSNQ